RRLARVGIVAAADGPRLQPALGPGERLVSVEGDLWRWDGLRRSAGREGAEAAMRLQQANRLTALEESLTAARSTSTAAREAHKAAAAALTELTQREQAARTTRRKADDA